MPPRFERDGALAWLAAANRVTAGRERLPNTAHRQQEAPMTAQAVAGGSFCASFLALTSNPLPSSRKRVC
jgi:hypothetical protein